MENDFTNGCNSCILAKEQFCLGDKCNNFYHQMWDRHGESLPECAKPLQEPVNNTKVSRLQRKAENRKRLDGSDYPARCYFAVLLYQTIRLNGRDPYSGLKIKWEDCDEGGKYNKAPAIDHIYPNCKAPFTEGTEGNRELNLVFCRNDVNDAKNDLTQKEFLELCTSVLKHHGYTVSAPSGVSGLSQE